MCNYRLYFHNTDGHIFGPAKIISANDDDEAVAQATAKYIAEGYYMELWLLDRLVATFQRQSK